MNSSIQDLKWRYAVKKFDPKRKLGQDQITVLKDAFCLTATSYGLQPISLVIIQNKELQEQLVAHSFDQQQVVDASHVLVICIQKNISQKYISDYYSLIKQVRGVPDKILNPFKKALVEDFSNKDVKVIREWSKNQAYLAMGNLLTVCAVEKIDSCPMEGFDPKAYDELLHLKDKGLASVLVLPVGYRASDDEFSGFKKVRKNMDESIIEIQ